MSRGHGDKLPRKQEQAIAALLLEPSLKAAAVKVGVSEPTLRSWLKLPGFQDAWRAARRHLVEEAVAKMQGAMGESVDTLRALLADTQAGPTRARAALGLLDATWKGLLGTEFTDRMDALEKRLDDAQLLGHTGYGGRG